MPVPETTSAEAFERYVGGKCLRGRSRQSVAGHQSLDRRTCRAIVDTLSLPSVSEPFLAWTFRVRSSFRNGKADGRGSRIGSRKGLSFSRRAALPTIAAGKRWVPSRFNPWRCSSSCRCCSALWRKFSAAMRRTPGCGMFPRFTDAALNSLMERLHEELMRRHASPLFLQGIAQAIAIHLARNYAEMDEANRAAAVRRCPATSFDKSRTGWRNTSPRSSASTGWRHRRG